MTVTLRDIASRAAVSVSTVSRVLNAYPYVDEATRATVLLATRELGYNAERKSTAAAQTSVVLMLTVGQTPPCENTPGLIAKEFERYLWTGARPMLASHNMILRLEHTCQTVEDARAYAGEPGVVGLILAGGSISRDFARTLQANHLPFVVAGAPLHPLVTNCVTAEYLRGMERAVTHLAERGRRRIGLVNGPEVTSSSTDKYRGYRLALAMQGLEYRPEWVRRGEHVPDAGYEQTAALIQAAPELDGIVYSSDQQAFGGLQALKERGRRVPEDVAVTGFYDFEISRFADPPLTTVHIDLQQMAAVAAQRLIMLLGAPRSEDWLITLPVELVIRGST